MCMLYYFYLFVYNNNITQKITYIFAGCVILTLINNCVYIEEKIATAFLN